MYGGRSESDDVVARWQLADVGKNVDGVVSWEMASQGVFAGTDHLVADGEKYTLIAGPGDSSISSKPLNFTKHDLETLDVGMYLFPDVQAASGIQKGALKAFRSSACSD